MVIIFIQKNETEKVKVIDKDHTQREGIISIPFLNLCFIKRKLMSSPIYQFDNLCPSHLPLCQTFKNLPFEGPQTLLLIIRKSSMPDTTT